MRGTSITLEEADTPTFMGIRQSEFVTTLTVTVSGEAHEAGVTYYMDEDQHYDLAVLSENEDKKVILRLRVGDVQAQIGSISLGKEHQEVEIQILSTPEIYSFYCIDQGEKKFLGSARTKYLSSEVAGGFTGVVMGMYVIDDKNKWAEFSKLSWIQGN